MLSAEGTCILPRISARHLKTKEAGLLVVTNSRYFVTNIQNLNPFSVLQPFEALMPIITNPHMNKSKPVAIEILAKVCLLTCASQ
jgi:hypothetical protein